MLGQGGHSGLCRLWLGAVVKLRPRDFQHDETCCVLRFQEKGGKPERDILANLDAEGIKAENKDRPLFRSAARWM